MDDTKDLNALYAKKQKLDKAVQEAQALNEQGVKLQQTEKFKEAVEKLNSAIELLKEFEENNDEV